MCKILFLLTFIQNAQYLKKNLIEMQRQNTDISARQTSNSLVVWLIKAPQIMDKSTVIFQLTSMGPGYDLYCAYPNLFIAKLRLEHIQSFPVSAGSEIT